MFNSIIIRRVEASLRLLFLVLLFFVFASSSAQAIRLNLSGSNLPAGMTGPVEFYRVVGSYDPPGGGDDVKIRLVTIAGGVLVNPAIPIVVSGTTIPLVSGGVEKDPNSLNDIDQGTQVYIRVWDGTAGQTHYYAQSPIRSISWLNTDPKVDWDISGWTKYLADKPQNVGVRVDSESILRTGNDQKLTLAFSAIHDGKVELLGSKSVLDISKVQNFTDVNDSTGGTKHFAPAAAATASGAYFTGNTTYYLRSQLGNYYGTTPLSMLTAPIQQIAKPGDSVTNAVGEYQTLGGGPSGGGSVTINLSKEAAGLGVNSIGIPFTPPINLCKEDGVTPMNPASITYLGDLISGINSSGSAKVTAAGYWGEDMKMRGITYDASGNPVYKYPADFDPATLALVPGRGYYLSVDKTIKIVLKK